MSSSSKPLPANFYFLENFANLKPGTAKVLLENAMKGDLPKVKPTQMLACPDPMEAFIYICSSLNDDLFQADGYWWKD